MIASQHCCDRVTCSRNLLCQCPCKGCNPMDTDKPWWSAMYVELVSAREELARVKRDYAVIEETLTIAQSRGTAQLGELRGYRQSVALPGLGWDCKKCGAFNGDIKERLTACRCCDEARPS